MRAAQAGTAKILIKKVKIKQRGQTDSLTKNIKNIIFTN